MAEKTPKELKIKGGVPGLSARQIDEHYNVLYKGYCNKINEITGKLTSVDLDDANATYSTIRELKREEVFTANAVRLHEGYFDNLGGDAVSSGTIKNWLEEDFGSVESWEKEFRACGMAARGWVILAYDLADGRLHNYLSDIHSDGVWGAIPLLILDVYEHAYFIDYATARKSYLDAFFKNIDWQTVNNLIDKYGLLQVREAA